MSLEICEHGNVAESCSLCEATREGREVTDEMVERAAQRLIAAFSFFDPQDNDFAWRVSRTVLAAALSTKREPDTWTCPNCNVCVPLGWSNCQMCSTPAPSREEPSDG